MSLASVHSIRTTTGRDRRLGKRRDSDAALAPAERQHARVEGGGRHEGAGGGGRPALTVCPGGVDADDATLTKVLHERVMHEGMQPADKGGGGAMRAATMAWTGGGGEGARGGVDDLPEAGGADGGRAKVVLGVMMRA